MSAILLETNGRVSSSKQTKHIKVRYFLIKDKVNWEKITVKHCLNNQMWMDINTKPKQGTVFWMFRGHAMGIPTRDTIVRAPPQVRQSFGTTSHIEAVFDCPVGWGYRGYSFIFTSLYWRR